MMLMFIGAGMDIPALLLVSIVGLFAALIGGVVLVQLAPPKKIDDHVVWLKTGQPFVDSLPYSPRG